MAEVMWVVSARYQIAAEASRPMPPTLVPLQVVLLCERPPMALLPEPSVSRWKRRSRWFCATARTPKKAVPARVSEITVL